MSRQRSAKEIREVFEKIKQKKARQGQKYTQTDFASDLGYSRRQTVGEILNNRTRQIPQVDIILDYMERDLTD